MSSGPCVNALARELDTQLDHETLARLPGLHADAYICHFDSVRALPGWRRAAEHSRPRTDVGSSQRGRSFNRDESIWALSAGMIARLLG
jgi:hypothetical protein